VFSSHDGGGTPAALAATGKEEFSRIVVPQGLQAGLDASSSLSGSPRILGGIIPLKFLYATYLINVHHTAS
jgi:hypothetical protein